MLKALVVDNDFIHYVYVVGQLAKMHYTIESEHCLSMIDGIEKIAKNHYDIIFVHTLKIDSVLEVLCLMNKCGKPLIIMCPSSLINSTEWDNYLLLYTDVLSDYPEKNQLLTTVSSKLIREILC